MDDAIFLCYSADMPIGSGPMEGERPTVELYVRSLRPDATANKVDAAVSRLRALEADGAIESLDVEIWGRQLPLDGPAADTDAARSIRETVQEIESWAAAEGVDVAPQFESRVVERDFGGPSYRARTLPTCCLVERHDGEVCAVAPYERNGETHTVTGRLDYLEATAAVDAPPTESDPTAIAD